MDINQTEMATTAAGIFKWLLIGGGTVLSLFCPAVGAPLIVAGVGMPGTNQTSADPLSTYASNLNNGLNMAGNMAAAGNVTSTVNNLLNKIMQNLPVILICIAALLFLPKLLKRRR